MEKPPRDNRKDEKDATRDAEAEKNSGENRTGSDMLLQEAFSKWMEHAGRWLPTMQASVFVCDSNGAVMAAYPAPHDARIHDLLQKGVRWSVTEMGGNALGSALQSGQPEHVKPDGHSRSALRECHTYAVPVAVDSEPISACIGLIRSTKAEAPEPFLLLSSIGHALVSHICCVESAKENQAFLKRQKLQTEETNRRDSLFEATKRLQSMIDVDSVLIEIMDSIKQMYPFSQVELFLSQDNHSSKLQVKPLSFQRADNNICTRAFVEGRVVTERRAESSAEICRIAAPLGGKQGVYGVLQLVSDQEYFADVDIKYISILADTAGTAFENAQLYKQSNTLISELRLINEITKRLNQSLKLNDIFSYASSELIEIFEADFCCVLQYDLEKRQLVVQACNFPMIANEYFEIDYGFSGVIFSSKEPIFVADYTQNTKIPSKLMEDTKSRSLIASPIIVNSEVIGVILVTHREANFFSYENFKLLQVLSGHIGLAMTNAALHAEVRRMVITDNLTGLHARHYLDEQISIKQKKDFAGSLILVDIDNFKYVNDTFGHQIGDKILIQVSQIILSCVRESDVAARWGGEELAIYLPQASKEQTFRVAERIRSRVLAETEPTITVSIGISDWHWEDEKISVEHLFYKADMALYDAKNSGKNQIKMNS